MSKKNSSVNLRNGFKDLKDISKSYINFKKKLKKLKHKSCVVAVSGGPDSLALVALTKALNFERGLKFYYVLVNHNIRKNSANESKEVKKLLKNHQIRLHLLSNKKKIKKNIQANARDIRYDLLKKFCYQKKTRVILTAHNLEDQVETFFIRLSRGSGLTGLSSMMPLTKLNGNIKLYRPLLDTKKKLLIKITKTVFGKYFKDPSNLNKKYLRSKIRKLAKPLHKSGINYDQIIKSINNLAISKATLEDLIQQIIDETIKISNKEVIIKTNKFYSYNLEIKRRIINESIKITKKNYYNPRSKKVINLIKMLENKDFKKATLGGCIFYKKNDEICLKKEKK